MLFFKKPQGTQLKCVFFNNFSVNLRFIFIKGLVLLYRLAANSQKSARIEFNKELFSITVAHCVLSRWLKKRSAGPGLLQVTYLKNGTKSLAKFTLENLKNTQLEDRCLAGGHF